MTGFDTKGYIRELAQYCLHTQEHPSTAGEISELMLTIVQGEKLPKEVQVATHASAVAGALRALANEGLATQVGGRPNGRNGRAEPTWTFAGARKRIPAPPHPQLYAQDAAPAGNLEAIGAIADLGRFPSMPEGGQPELLAVLRAHEDVGAACARFLRDLAEVSTRLSTQLQSLKGGRG